jgi:3-oxoadipate enol-lactonase
LRSRLRRITAPTLIVAGAQDGLVPTAVAETYAAEIPGARLEVIVGAAHWLPFEKPDELTALTKDFLAG